MHKQGGEGDTIHAAPMGYGFAGAKAAEEDWSDGQKPGGGLFF